MEPGPHRGAGSQPPFADQGWYVATATNDGDNLKGRAVPLVNDQEVAYRPKEYRAVVSKVFAPVTSSWRVAEKPERFYKLDKHLPRDARPGLLELVVSDDNKVFLRSGSKG